MKIYIDFDDVLVNTHEAVMKLKRDSQDEKEYIRNNDWNKILNKVKVINNSLTYLKETKLDVYILSKVSTLNEAEAKVRFLRKNGIKNNIHIVPNILKKDDIVSAKGNILVDDKIYNLDNWVNDGGKAIYFNKYNHDTDVYGKVNTKYPMINSLEFLVNDKDYIL